MRHLLGERLGLEFSVSATSRTMRANEVDGKDYFFLSVDEFKGRIAAGEFVEYEEVYPGRFMAPCAASSSASGQRAIMPSSMWMWSVAWT